MSVLRRGAIAAAVLAIVLQWVNTRASILHVNQDPAHPVILDTYAFYHLMAMGLRRGASAGRSGSRQATSIIERPIRAVRTCAEATRISG